jgi:hypothetical protein
MTPSVWLVIAGGAGALVGTLLLPWYSYPLIGTSYDLSAWHSSLGKLATAGALVLAAGAVVVLMGHNLPARWLAGLLAVGVGVAGAALAKRIDLGAGAALGLYLTIAAGPVSALGAYGLGAGLGVPGEPDDHRPQPGDDP